MKKVFAVIAVSAVLLLSVSVAGAATVSVVPGPDALVASPGDSLVFDIVFTADEDGDVLEGFTFNLGYDAGELAFDSYTAFQVPGWTEFMGYAEDVTVGSGNYVVNYNENQMDFNGSGVALGMNESLVLGSFKFNVLEEIAPDGLADVWFEDSVATDTGTYQSIVSFNGDFGVFASTITAHQGADVAPVPVPAALWLLGSGLAGVFGFRRKTAG